MEPHSIPKPPKTPAPRPPKPQPLAAPNAGRITLRSSDDPKNALTAQMGLTDPAITSGFGGWQEITRPQRRALVQYTGSQAWRQTITILLDGWGDNTSVEKESTQLQAMAVGNPPPTLTIAGTGLWRDGDQWVIETLDLDTVIRDTGSGALLRVQYTVGLLQVTDVDPLEIASLRTPASAGQRLYVVKKGDTFQKIAQRFLGKASRWPEITDLNGIRDPGVIDKMVGKTIRIPAK